MVNSKPTEAIASLDDAINRCQSLGMRVSRQRRFILELLWQDSDHLSAREIYNRLNQAGKSIGHTSVYQNLEALTNKGLIECVDRYDGRLYGSFTDSHSHVHYIDSTGTARIMDIRIQLPAETIRAVELETGTIVTDYRIEFFGHKAVT